MDSHSPRRTSRSQRRATRPVTLVGFVATLIAAGVAQNASADDRDTGIRSAPVVHARFHLSDEPRLIAPDSHDNSPNSPTGRSPYDTWPDRGQRPERDRAAEQEQLFPVQMAWINAAYGGQGYRDGEHVCAGCPLCIRRHAAPSDTGRYVGYYVGGGTVFRGEGRYLDEGTWGWDYRGCVLEPRIVLGWSHSRMQSGTGAYATDRRK